jgi:hypothetical protein
MFSDAFYRLLEKDVLGVKEKPVSRMQRGGPSLGAASQKMVPDVHRVDLSLHPKVEMLRERPSGRIVLNDKDVSDIMKLYNIKNLSPEEPRYLGTTKIIIRYDGTTQRYNLIKN